VCESSCILALQLLTLTFSIVTIQIAFLGVCWPHRSLLSLANINMQG